MEWSEKGHLALSALNVKNGYIDKSVNAHYADENLYQKWMTGNELEKGQVLFTTEAPMGNVAQIPDNEKYVLSQRTIAFEVLDNEITNDFLAVILSSKNVFNRLQTLSSGATAKGVSQKSLAQLLITVPNSLKEQTRIGIFFKSLDSLIAANQRQQKSHGYCVLHDL
ncbi:Type I restriction-modification system, specificity subunit S [Pediococcus damnosus]|uniref:restriction endonuclease subunit S n=1 Tax=Pediococcus damnosus TaxID=51663 RepID=UPI00078C4909|nr:restriction endonuclease subunit S [Pediococcus damnosus]AMV69805.1 Type I restriction-modification system, specificity subunit S [Pediococcus damnosus]